MLKKEGYIKFHTFPWRGTIPHMQVSQASWKDGLLATEVLAAPSGHGDHTENIRRQIPVAYVSSYSNK